jgi:hypothetical protein
MGGLSRGVAMGLGMAALAASAASPDEIFLRSGGRVTGVVLEQTRTAIVIETGPGRVTLPLSIVEKVVEGRSLLEAFHERAEALAPGDVQGWSALARWAAERDLVTQSREAWQRVLAADPDQPEANAALGRVEVDGTWMGEAEAYRARGYVSFEGRWVTPAEHEALVRERAIEEASEREAHESGLRVREAEARAREAEARAREAEASAQPVDGGIPYGYGWGWGGGVLVPGFDPGRPGHPTRPGHASRPPGAHPSQPPETPHSPPSPRPATRPQPTKARPAGVDPPPPSKRSQD